MTSESHDDIFDPAYVKSVFDRCSRGYRVWSEIASFGFIHLWRRQCVDGLPPFPRDNAEGLDLMAGTGEVWPILLRRRPGIASITAVDISSEMNRRAVDRLHRTRIDRIKLIEADVLTSDLAPGTADFVISTFGLKTFNHHQQQALARQIANVLKSGGVFSVVEASDPRDWQLHRLYRFYLGRVLPLIEKTMLKGAHDFSMIGVYTRHFGDCRYFAACLANEGLIVEHRSHFFGCATGVVGSKP